MKILIKELATLLGISTQAIDNWRISKGFNNCIDEDKKVNLLKVVRWLYDWIKDLQESQSTSDASEEKKKWEALKVKITCKQMLGELISKAGYLQTERERLLIIKTHSLSLEDSLARELKLSPEEKAIVRQKVRGFFAAIQDSYKDNAGDWIDKINALEDLEEVIE